MWSHTKLQVQTEMLPALEQSCRECPYIQHMLLLVRLGKKTLPRAMWMTHSNLRAGVEALAQHYPALWPYMPPLETEDSVTCASLIGASELRREAGRFYRAWSMCQAMPVRVLRDGLTAKCDAEVVVQIERLRGGDIELVPMSPPVPHPPYRERG